MEERVELKFMVNIADYHHLKRQLELFMSEDEFSTHDRGYYLSSLYFDDMYDSATYEKADGVEYHKKYRIRKYEDGRKRLEYKVKNGNITIKESMFLDDFLETALIEGKTDIMANHVDSPLINNMLIKMKLDNMKPSLYIDYFREIYTFANNDIRITFDKDIVTYNEFNTNQKHKILEPQTMIMEVKFRKYLPSSIKKIVLHKNYQPIPYSKYLMGWLKLNNWGV